MFVVSGRLGLKDHLWIVFLCLLAVVSNPQLRTREAWPKGARGGMGRRKTKRNLPSFLPSIIPRALLHRASLVNTDGTNRRLGYLPFTLENRKSRLENRMVRTIRFGKLQKIWALIRGDTIFLLFLACFRRSDSRARGKIHEEKKRGETSSLALAPLRFPGVQLNSLPIYRHALLSERLEPANSFQFDELIWIYYAAGRSPTTSNNNA